MLTDTAILEKPAVKKLMGLALASAKKPLDPKQRRRLIIKSVSAKQRPRANRYPGAMWQDRGLSSERRTGSTAPSVSSIRSI